MAKIAKKDRRFSFANLSGWLMPKFGKGKAAIFEKSEYGIWAETLNPLRGLTAPRAQDIFDRARRGLYAELTYLYNEIEAADPTLLVCTERREGATALADWRVSTLHPERTAGWEDNLADEQREFLERAYGRAGDAIDDVAEHLARAFFRGFAHARPVYEGNALVGFELYNQWNFARDPASGEWWWNPDAAMVYNERFDLIPQTELVTLERSRHIDYPALSIYIRAALGERRWGIFLERYGIPPVTIIMPEFALTNEEQQYMTAAERVAKGGSGALPYGSDVRYATEARGTNPFADFLRHQQEHIVMLATGGLLTTLTAAGSGTLAGEAHTDTWRQIVARDIRLVARALNRRCTHDLLNAEFPGRSHLAQIEMDANPAPTAKAIFEDAAAARAGGYLIDKGELENRTGYTLVEDKGGDFGSFGGAVFNKATATPLQNAAFPLQNRDTAKVGSTGDPTGQARTEPHSGLKSDPLAAALAVLEAGGEPEAALDAYDAAAREFLQPEQIALTAEQVAAEMEAAAAEIFGAVENKDHTKDGKYAKKGTGDHYRKGELLYVRH